MQPTHQRRFIVLMLALSFALPVVTNASGTYSARPPRPPVKAAGEKLDSAKYELGKRIYNGKANLSAAPAAAGADARLATLQTRLPEREAKKTNLTTLAGKLTAEQLDALEYYVAHRFPNK